MKKKMACIFLAIICLVPSTLSVKAAALPFTDVKTGDWFFEGVSFVYSAGLVNGTTPTTFSPFDTITREDAVVMLGRFAEQLGVSVRVSNVPYNDVRGGTYYFRYLCWAYQNNIARGVTPTTFGLGKSITREDFSVMLYRFANYINYKIQPRVSQPSFTDNGSISNYAIDAVYTCARGGIIGGYPDGSFRPKVSLIRGEAAILITNYIQYHVS